MPAHSLSWSRDGTRLCVIGEGLTVWEVSKLVQYKDRFPRKIVYELLPDDSPVPLFSLGFISPDSMLVAASALFSETSQVWSLTEISTARCTRITHGSHK